MNPAQPHIPPRTPDDWKQLFLLLGDALAADELTPEELESLDLLGRVSSVFGDSSRMTPERDAAAYRFDARVQQGRVVCTFQPQHPGELLALVADEYGLAVLDPQPGDSFPLPREPHHAYNAFGRYREVPHTASLLRIDHQFFYDGCSSLAEAVDLAHTGYGATGTWAAISLLGTVRLK